MKRTIAALLAAGAAASAAIVLAAPAHAAPPSNGCPSNWTLFHYETELQGYIVPAEVDSELNTYSFGNKPGNANGYVCGVALGNQTFGDNKQRYNFMDDSLKVEG